MKKRGFTLTEIIAALVILGVIFAIAIPSVSHLHNKFKKEYYIELDKTVLESGKKYYKDNSEVKPAMLLGAGFANYTDPIIKQKYISSVKKYRSDEECNGKVIAVKMLDDYVYVNCMDCSPDYINYDLTKTEGENNKICKFTSGDIIVKYYIPTDKYIYLSNYNNAAIQKTVCIPESVVRMDSTGTVEKYRIDNDTSALKCPTNITSINNERVGSYRITYKNIITSNLLTVDLSSDVYVFQHDAPTFVEDDPDYLVYKTGDNYYVNGKIKVNLDNTTTFNEKYHSELDRFEIHTADWETMNKIGNYSASYSFGDNSFAGNVIFRVVGNDTYAYATDSIEYGKESNEYFVVSKKVTVTFDHNDGSGIKETRTMWAGFPLEKANVPTRSGYSFNGYYDSPTGGTKYIDYNGLVNGNIKIYNDITLYAHWTNNTNGLKYDCTTNGGKCDFDDTDINLSPGDEIDLSRTATKTGWQFIGWNTSSSAQTGYVSTSSNIPNDLKKMGSSSKIIYAIYKKIVTINFYQPNGTYSSPTCTMYNTSTTCSITSPELINWTDPNELSANKVGWAASSSSTTSSWSANTKKANISNNADYYALYSYPVTISYSPNGGSGTMDASYGTGYIRSNKTDEPSITKASIDLKANEFTAPDVGHLFTGWNTKANGSGYDYSAGTASFMYTRTLHAQWTPKVITVKFVANGGKNDKDETVVSKTYTYGNKNQKFSAFGFEFNPWKLSGWKWVDNEGKTHNYEVDNDVSDSWINGIYNRYPEDHTVTLTAIWKKNYVATFDYKKAGWYSGKGNDKPENCSEYIVTYEEDNKTPEDHICKNTCSITYGETSSCNVNIPLLKTEKLGKTGSYENYGNLEYNDLFDFSWYNRNKDVTIDENKTVNQAKRLNRTISSNETFSAVVKLKYFTFHAFPNDLHGLYARGSLKQLKYGENFTGMINTNNGVYKTYVDAVQIGDSNIVNSWAYRDVTAQEGHCREGNCYPIYIYGSLTNTQTNACIKSGATGTICTNKWYPAAWLSWVYEK